MLHAGNRQHGVTVEKWLLWGLSHTTMLLDKHEGSQSATTAEVKAEWNHRYENNECFVRGKQGHKQWGYP